MLQLESSYELDLANSTTGLTGRTTLDPIDVAVTLATQTLFDCSQTASPVSFDMQPFGPGCSLGKRVPTSSAVSIARDPSSF